MNKRYRLAAGTQVREEDFGLLFYQMKGPRLHFVATGNLLTADYFQGEMTLAVWMDKLNLLPEKKTRQTVAISEAMKRLSRKGIVVEC